MEKPDVASEFFPGVSFDRIPKATKDISVIFLFAI
jgi:hypothetical protein